VVERHDYHHQAAKEIDRCNSIARFYVIHEMSASTMSSRKFLRRAVLLIPLVASTACLNPYACRAEYRFAEYKGILGVDEHVTREVDQREPGRIYLSLDQGRGVDPFQQVTIALNVWGFADSVAQVHVHRATGRDAGRTLYSTSAGYMVRDSVWNGYPQQFASGTSWQEFWEILETGDAYLEIHPGGDGAPVRGRLTLSRTRGFQPSCT
jgi:hypothetical protein